MKHNKTFEVTDNLKGSIKKYEILNHDIKELHAQALLDSTSFLCVYFPTQVKTYIKEVEVDIDWKNMGYFVTSNGSGKQIMRIDQEYILKNFKVNVVNTFYPRWPYSDFLLWSSEAGRIDPSGVFFTILDTAKRYIEFDDESTYNVYVLWIIGTYFFRLFDAYPYLDFTGTKRAGKTKTLELIKLIAFNPIMSPDFSGSSIFRLIEGTCGTILLDEAETFKNVKSENAQHVRTLLVQGFLKDQHAYRTNKDSFDVQPFNLFSPKALAHIHSFDDVLEDRCIQIVMKRSTNTKIQNSYPSAHFVEFREIRCMLYRLALDYSISLESYRQKADESMPVAGRERLLWLPILTLACLFQSFGVAGLVESISKYAEKNHIERQGADEESNPDVKIASFLMTQVSEDEWKLAREIHEILMTEENRKRYQIHEKYSVQAFSSALRRLGIPNKRHNTGNHWQINRENIGAIWDRLGLSEEKKVSQVSQVSLYERKNQEQSDTSDTSDTKLSDYDTMGGEGVLND